LHSCQLALDELVSTRRVLVETVNSFREARVQPAEWCREKLELISIMSRDTVQALSDYARLGQQKKVQHNQCVALQGQT
jgi:hypothetical protein